MEELLPEAPSLGYFPQKQLKTAGFPPDIADNCRGNEGRKTSPGSKIKEDTGLRCGGRGKSEISSAL